LEERLQKYLSAAGIASRRKAEEMILAGRVSVNGKVAKLGEKVSENDKVSVDGKEVESDVEKVYLMLHKPEGYITSTHDQFNRPDVMSLIPDSYPRVYPVGRLDYDTSGLLILTNDGALAQALTHPSHQAAKVYMARLRGTPSPEEIKAFCEGLEVEGARTAPASIAVVKPEQNGVSSVKITIREGKNRQVRKMCEAIGHPVVFLKRVATGNIYLGELKRGEIRELTPAEVRHLKSFEAKRR
jgi:pseudouridine synthase